MIIGRKEQKSKFSVPSMLIGNSCVLTTTTARNIGVIQDDELSMVNQISAICRSAYFHLRNIGQVRKYLNKQATEAIIHAFVSSRLDNGNAILYGLPKSQIDKLQRIQNTAARIILRIKKHDHISVHLKSLPIRERIELKKTTRH
jgi:hypothetical protein